jgi:tricorn protease
MSQRIVPAELRRRVLILFVASIVAGFVSVESRTHAQNSSSGTRLLRTPTVSATQIAFAYGQNIWVVTRAGGMARRVTSFQGQTTNPHFSPDGKWIAFSGEYAGNMDVYVVAGEGGEPRRLTWHPGADLVQGWTADGKSILFSSTRAT